MHGRLLEHFVRVLDTNRHLLTQLACKWSKRKCFLLRTNWKRMTAADDETLEVEFVSLHSIDTECDAWIAFTMSLTLCYDKETTELYYSKLLLEFEGNGGDYDDYDDDYDDEPFARVHDIRTFYLGENQRIVNDLELNSPKPLDARYMLVKKKGDPEPFVCRHKKFVAGAKPDNLFV